MRTRQGPRGNKTIAIAPCRSQRGPCRTAHMRALVTLSHAVCRASGLLDWAWWCEWKQRRPAALAEMELNRLDQICAITCHAILQQSKKVELPIAIAWIPYGNSFCLGQQMHAFQTLCVSVSTGQLNCCPSSRIRMVSLIQ